MASIGEVVAALRQVVADLPFAPLAEALDLVEDAKALIERALHGTEQDEFWQVVECFEKTAEGISELQQLLTAIQQTATAAASRLEGHGSPSGPVGPDPQSPANPSPAVDRAKGAPDPEGLLAKLPVRTKADPKTRGIWIDDQGQQHDQIVSGRDELAAIAADELRRLGISPARGSLMTADHVEVKLAVHLRGTSQRHVTLAINNAPCRIGEFSCDRLLPLILRPGQAVTVYWPGGMKTYKGGAA